MTCSQAALPLPLRLDVGTNRTISDAFYVFLFVRLFLTIFDLVGSGRHVLFICICTLSCQKNLKI